MRQQVEPNKMAEVNRAIVREIWKKHPEADRFQIARLFLKVTGHMVSHYFCEANRPKDLAPPRKKRRR